MELCGTFYFILLEKFFILKMSQVFAKGLTKNLSKFNSIFANKSFVRSLCNVTIGKDGIIVSNFRKLFFFAVSYRLLLLWILCLRVCFRKNYVLLCDSGSFVVLKSEELRILCDFLALLKAAD